MVPRAAQPASRQVKLSPGRMSYFLHTSHPEGWEGRSRHHGVIITSTSMGTQGPSPHVQMKFLNSKKPQKLWFSNPPLALLQRNVFTEVARDKRGKRRRNHPLHPLLHSQNSASDLTGSIFISGYCSNQQFYPWGCKHSYTRILNQWNPPSQDRNPQHVA